MRSGFVRAAALGLACSVAMFAAQPACAKAVSRAGFELPADETLKIVVFRPDVKVGSLKAGGLTEPNADWTEAARANIQAAMAENPELKGSEIVYVDELVGGDAELLQQYRGMFEIVSGAMFTHVTQGNNYLPSKVYEIPPVAGDKFKTKPQKASRIDWTLGNGASRLRDATGADYAMFVFTNDAYGDSGRKAAQAVGLLGCLVGFCVIMQAGVHVGYAGLVDLKTGDVVWFNTDLAMGGDVRETDGAVKRVSQLLEGFPKRGASTGEAVEGTPVEVED